MLYIYCVDSDQVHRTSALKDLLKEIPAHLHQRALRYKFPQSAYNFVLGRILLKKGLAELEVSAQLEDITYQKNGKPELPGVHFNITHSENLVVCAISTQGVIGIDVEKEKPLSIDNFKSWFTPLEWEDINQSMNPLRRFYWYWTRKESIIKALGVKLSYLLQIELDATQDFFIENDKKWFLQDLDFGEGYFGALCSEGIEDYIFYHLNEEL